MIKLCLFISLFAASAVGQVPTFTDEDTLTILWNPSPSSDVEFYKAYFVETDTVWDEWKEIRQLTITEWGTQADTCSYIYEVPLFVSHWLLFMTAIDFSGNESIPSEQVKFVIVDSRPLSPFNIRILIR